MKKLLIVGILLGAASGLLRADGVGTAGAGSSASVQADAAGTTAPAHKAKKHAHKKALTQTIALSVTEDGFVPAEIKIKKGELTHLVVTRETDQTCAKQIVIPGYGLSADLPLNVPVTLAFTPKSTGDIHYSCGMGMLHGVLSAE
jgi:plastocyanin domain-containing protein